MNGYAVLLVYIAIVVVSIIVGIFISNKVVKKFTKFHFIWVIIIGIFIGLFVLFPAVLVLLGFL